MQPVALHDLIAALDAETVGIADGAIQFERVEVDSRRVRSGDIFWAIVGDRDDGHRYIAEALSKGAIACVVEHDRCDTSSGRLLIVDDTVLALWDFAEWYRQQFDTLVVGVTGTVGKTTTRHMLQNVLSARYNGIESPENFNNYLGVPLSVLQLDRHHEFAALELAASHVGEIEDLAGIAQPEIGVITNISPVHLDEFGTIEAIMQAKGELLEALPESGFAILNGDNQLVRQLAERASCPVIFVGEQSHNDVVAQWVRVENGWLRFCVDSVQFDVPAVGRHHITSAIAAVALGRQVDLTDEEIAAGLRMFEPVPGRCELRHIGPWTVINDTYNASPASMQAACQTLHDWQTEHKKILVAGDMLALGSASAQYHRELGQIVAACDVDQLIAVGSEAASLAGSARMSGMDAGSLGACDNLSIAELLLDCWLQPGDVLLVKGSRDMHMERVLTYLEQRAAQVRAIPSESKAA
ncbi:MAG: UDP-N-acetylmuramoyl-tripeptide--D-alanyl-D-alanine ligase [Planctomycetaceae bacterium]|nr:UDP-N-acetylmuramoyl-tripeptide--D-alanyl-D-alanine ligase [Planctomycetaceae bacterium]MCB9950424.1 UDP-N-acetylmuramoyl-tripeptide--D-alanyl-D-alanine ligase [Planctomycetaceae bacterium]